ncbi:TPA: hypothetical protein KE767_004290 [Citrobacter koseri]|nr:hypothetical protein [Citrobacter koseri]
MKYQIAKIYRGDYFLGYGIAVDGQLLDGQVSSSINSEPFSLPTVTVVFNLNKDHAENQITIDIDEKA